jgi:hypothetical protein
LFALGSAASRGEEPLHEQIPYDEVKLDETNGNTILRVRPLNLVERRVPAPGNRRGDLEIELLDRPGEKFALSWANVVSVQLFEERVLEEAQQLVAAGRFDEAQVTFQFLEQKYSSVPGLSEAIEGFLWQQITASFRAGRPEETLALLVELHRRRPNRPGLAVAYERTTLELVKARLAARQYRGARGLLTSLARKFPDTGPAAVTPFQAQMQEQATQQLTQAQAAVAAEKWSEAHSLCAQALELWPGVAGGLALAQQIHERFPVVTVGVLGTPAVQTDFVNGPMLHRWNARRWRLLLATPLAQLVDSDKGLVYRSAFGKWSAPANTPRATLHLDDAAPIAGLPLSAVNVAQQAVWDRNLASHIVGLRAHGAQELSVEFSRPALRPEAWLSMHVQQPGLEPDAAASQSWGPYILQSSMERATFQRRPEIAAPPAAPQLVYERTLVDSSQALLALRRGQISALDRVPPWDVERFRAVNELRVVPYAVPTVHLLIPNAHKRLTANRTFRRALLVALDRESILKQGLLTDQNLPGCQVISGPFPKGQDRDAWSYAYNDTIAPREYDPGLAAVLMELARAEVNSESKEPTTAPLILAHDDQPVAKVACQSIARQLVRAGQPVTLQQLTPGQRGEEADLRYVEVALNEPLVDAWALLGPQGLAGPCSPLMLEYFRSLEKADQWSAAKTQLKAIHRLTAAELPVIPLWQTTNYAAYHASLQGIADRPVSLYEDLLRWQVAWRQPQE